MTGAVSDNDPRLRVILDALPAAVAYYDDRRVCQFASARYLALFTAPHTIIGSRLDDHLASDALTPLVQAVLTGSNVHEARHIVFPSGHRYFDVRLTPDAADGKVRGFTMALGDLTEQERVDETRAFFNEAIAILESEGDAAIVWQRICDAAISRHADWCTIHVRRGDGASHLAAAAHRDRFELEHFHQSMQRIGITPGSAVDEVLSARPARLATRDSIDDLFAVPSFPLPYHTALIVPLVGRDGGTAAMTVGVVDPTYAYSDVDLALADDLSRRFGLAASNARLYRAEQRARRAAERAVERTTRLQAITAQLAAALDTEAIGNIVVGQAIAAMRAYAGCMVMPSSDGAFLELLHAHGYSEAQIQDLRSTETSLDRPVTRAFRNARPVWIHSPDDYLREFPAVAPMYPSTLAIAAIPLVVHERPSAVLALAFNEPQAFTPEDQSFLYALARQGAQAIERARLHREARDADRRKDEFLAMLSHELRNPLAPMLTGIQLIRETPDAAQRERLLTTVERQVHHLARLVDDLLDVSRFTRGKIELKRALVEAGMIVKAAADAAAHIMTSRNHVLEVFISEPLWIDADPVRIEQILANLLNNAAKYTEPGGKVTLSLSCDGDDVLLRVRDNGMGIPDDVVPHVFEPFMQASRALDRAQGGLGIGLTMVKRIAEMHGGRVSAYSAGVGLGSEFAVRLPRMEPPVTSGARVTVPRNPAKRASSLRVLVVDDNVDAAESLAQLLTLWGHRVEIAGDGPSALRIAGALGPELVLLDIGLPGMDGYQVAAALRATDPRIAGTRVIAVSGYGQARDRERSREAGFDAHLTKPVDIARLRQLVSDIARLE